METDSEAIAETPDLNFSEDMAEQETPDINFSEIELNPGADTANKIREHYTAEDSDIDDLDQPDQYVEGDDDVEETNHETDNTNHNESGLNLSTNLIKRVIYMKFSTILYIVVVVAPVDKSKAAPKSKDSSDNRLVHLPSARVKHIMKVDPDVTLITGECTFLVTKATELFIGSLAREAFLHTSQAKKKTVQKRDVDAAIENVESLMFLEGMMNF